MALHADKPLFVHILFAGFPLRQAALNVPGFSTAGAQGMQGGELPECPGTVRPGKCAFTEIADAAFACLFLQPKCSTLVVYQHGGRAWLASPVLAPLLPPGVCWSRSTPPRMHCRSAVLPGPQISTVLDLFLCCQLLCIESAPRTGFELSQHTLCSPQQTARACCL